MLTPKLKGACSECSDIPILLDTIDCRLANLAGDLYNNLVFMLNKPIPAGAIIDLLTYRRILQYKQINPDYAGCYTVEQIGSKINILKFKK